MSREEATSGQVRPGDTVKNMVIDAVIANDEIDLAKFRISYLGSRVEKFYIAESEQTFQGRSKPLNFAPRAKELQALGADIEIIQIPRSDDDEKFVDAWERGRYQRYWFLEEIAKRHEDAAIIFTDIDEVPSHEQLEWANTNLDSDGIATIPMTFVFRYANWLLEPIRQDYRPGVILRGTAFEPNIRDGDFPRALGEKGAHLSYVGFTAEQVKEKFSSFEHTELDLEHLYQEKVLDFANDWGIDHIGRPGQPGFGLLRGASESDMNSVLKEAIGMFPHWYREFPTKSLVRRVAASSSLSLYRSTGDAQCLEDSSQPLYSYRFLRHLVGVGLHTLIRLTGTGTIVKRLQKFIRSLKPATSKTRYRLPYFQTPEPKAGESAHKGQYFD